MVESKAWMNLACFLLSAASNLPKSIINHKVQKSEVADDENESLKVSLPAGIIYGAHGRLKMIFGVQYCISPQIRTHCYKLATDIAQP